LNGGELEYWVSESGRVKQVNVLTGEKYEHPSLEAMFHQTSAKTKAGGVAWTIRASGGDSFEIELVGCPNEVCEVFTPLRLLKPETWEEYTYNSVSVKKFLHWTWMQASVGTGKVRIEDIDLFTKLRRYVAGKKRTPALQTELMNHARRLCNKLDIISIHGGGAHEVPVASMNDYVQTAFYVDARAELDMAISMHRDNAKLVLALNKYYEDGTMPKDFVAASAAATWTARMFSDQAVKIINSLKAHSEVTVAEYLEMGLPMPDGVNLLIEWEPDEKIPAPWIGW